GIRVLSSLAILRVDELLDSISAVPYHRRWLATRDSDACVADHKKPRLDCIRKLALDENLIAMLGGQPEGAVKLRTWLHADGNRNALATIIGLDHHGTRQVLGILRSELEIIGFEYSAFGNGDTRFAQHLSGERLLLGYSHGDATGRRR